MGDYNNGVWKVFFVRHTHEGRQGYIKGLNAVERREGEME